MERWYKCPQCGNDVLYITNPCSNCKLRLDWRQKPPIPYIPPTGEPPQKAVQPTAMRKTQESLPLEGLLESEMAECDTFFGSHGISKEMRARGSEETDQYFQQYLEECVKQNRFNRVWVYHSLGTWYLLGGKFEEAVSIYSRAASEYPNDPRPYYTLGTIYYNISQALLRERLFEIQKLISRDREFEEENKQFINASQVSKLAASPMESANLALSYFRRTLECNISASDKTKIQTHIGLVETWISNLKHKG